MDAGEEVIRVDIDRGFKPTIVADVQNLPLRTGLKPKLAIFCPPCQCFSIIRVWHYWKNGKPNHPKTHAAIQLVKRGMEEIRRLAPRYWIMENPVGMLRTVVGRPSSTIRQSDYGASWKKPTDLWGNVPFRMLSAMRSWPKVPRGNHLWDSVQGNQWKVTDWPNVKGYSKKARSAARAKWPYGLSQAVLEALS